MPITVQAVQQVASESGKTVLDTITLLQAGAVATNDHATLDALCEIKAGLIGLADL